MKHGQTACVASLAPLLALAGAVHAQNCRVAIVCPERTQGTFEIVLSHLEVGLSEEAGIDLVERREIQAILDELALSSAGLQEPGGAIRLGELLNAEMILFVRQSRGAVADLAAAGQDVENERGVPTSLLMMRAVETKTGIALGDLVERETTLAEDMSSAIALARTPQAGAARTQARYAAASGSRRHGSTGSVVPTTRGLSGQHSELRLCPRHHRVCDLSLPSALCQRPAAVADARHHNLGCYRRSAGRRRLCCRLCCLRCSVGSRALREGASQGDEPCEATPLRSGAGGIACLHCGARQGGGNPLTWRVTCWQRH